MPSQLLNRAAKFCASKETCVQDIRRKLTQWGADQQQAAQIISYLLENGFIDHSRYAKAFANDKLRFNHWGKKKIAYALQQKQIEEQYINEALEQIDEQDYIAILEKVLQQKIRSTKDPAQNRMKIANYALGKGFEYELINQLLDRLLTQAQ